MKKFLLFTLTLSLILTGCNDDNLPSNNDDAQQLAKIITYTPSKQSYDSSEPSSYKNVQYFENGTIVADTTFDVAGTVNSRVAHNYLSNSHELRYYYGTSLMLKLTYTYDEMGRIVEIKSDNSFLYQGFPNQGISYTKYAYQDILVVREAYDENYQLMPQYTKYYPLNEMGLITFDSGFVGDKLVVNNLSQTPVNLTYYDVSKPANMLKDIHQLNNLFIEVGEYRVNMAENNNYYLKTYSYLTYEGMAETVNFESSFDEQGYITYTKGIGMVANYQADRNLERFYYYD